MNSAPRLVVITGATRGLGRQIADRFWKSADNLILIARHESELNRVADELASMKHPHQTINTYPADLTDLTSLPELIKEIKKNCGNPDILINNAAIQGPIGPVHSNDWSEWQDCLNVCLLAPVQLTRGFLQSMIENRYGRIVTISGGGATTPRPNFSSYATAKCGIVRFSETLAKEVAPYGITVNCVAPGAMKSSLTQAILDAGPDIAGSAEFTKACGLFHENPDAEVRASDLVHFLTTAQCAQINGKLISAIWDPWERLPDIAKDIQDNDVYTLRRILPEERNIKIG